MKHKWTIIMPSSRWVTTALTKRGWAALHAFPSGAWSITMKEAESDENPRGILLSSFETGPVGRNLDDAMRLAEKAAETLTETTHAE